MAEANTIPGKLGNATHADDIIVNCHCNVKANHQFDLYLDVAADHYRRVQGA